MGNSEGKAIPEGLSIEERLAYVTNLAWDMVMLIGVNAVTGKPFTLEDYHRYSDMLEALDPEDDEEV